MIINNSKHMVAYRTIRSQQFTFLVELIDVVSDMATVSSHISSKSSTRHFMHVQSFRYLCSILFFTLTSTNARVPSIIFFAYAMFYWFFILTLTLIIILFMF